MNATVLIPIKALKNAKSRLAKHINPKQREQLMLLLLKHIIKTVKAVDNDLEIYVVSFDKKVIKTANLLGIKNISEKISGHNRSLTFAAKKINQNKPVLALSVDLPLLTKTDIEQLFLLSKKNDIVLAQSKEKTGTNAVIMKTPLLIPYQFGENSLIKFISTTKEKSLTVKTYFNDNFAFDVDTIKDLEELQKINSKLLQDFKIKRVL
jgi:2-phospho-L-lactate/phosphoenolpyruvate guanylyltransferase